MQHRRITRLSFLSCGLAVGAHVSAAAELQLVELVRGSVMDLTRDRILYNPGARMLKMRDRATGLDQTVASLPLQDPFRAFIAPRGAIFVDTAGTLYDWRDGVLSELDD